MDIDPQFAPLVYQAGGAHVDAFCSAMRDEGYDVRVYELNTALAAALSDSQSRGRFEAKRDAFPDIRGEDVTMEFQEACWYLIHCRPGL